MAVECGDEERDGGDGDPGPDARAEGNEALVGGPRNPARQHDDDAGDGADGARGEENSLHRFAPRAEEEGEVENGPDEVEAAHVDVLADVAVDAEAELAEDPGGNEEQREGLLRLVAEQHPAADAASAQSSTAAGQCS